MLSAWILTLLTSLTPPASAPVRQTPEVHVEDRAALDAQIVHLLEKYVDWCAEKQLWIEHRNAFKVILEFDPKNMRAMQALGYKQVSDGVWQPPTEELKPAKNWDLAAAKEAPSRRAKMIKPWRDAMVALTRDPAAKMSESELDEIHDRILLVDPDDSEIRHLRGEVHMTVTVDNKEVERWVMAETAAAKDRRKEIKDFVKENRSDVPKAEEVLPTEADKALGVEWPFTFKTPVCRVLTTGDRDEALRVIHIACEIQKYFRFVLGAASEYPPDFTIYLLTKKGEQLTFLEHHPKVTEGMRSFFANLTGTGFPDSGDAAWWDDDASRRLDGITRHTIGNFFMTTFHITTAQGWAWEGLGLYLTRELIGTRLTWYVQPAAYSAGEGKSTRARLIVADANWMDEAFKVINGPKCPNLAELLSRNVNKMTIEDLLYSYALAAFLIEAKPAELSQLLHKLGSGVPPETAVQSALGMDLTKLEQRLRRWLGERR